MYTDNKISVKCKASCCKTCSFCARAATKEKHKSWVSRVLPSNKLQIKISAKCFLWQLSCVKTSAVNVASNLPVGARLQNFWQTWQNLVAGPKVVQILKEGYTLPFRIRPKLTRYPTCRKLLCKSQQEELPAGGIASAYRQERSRAGTKSKVPGFLQQTIFSPKTKQQMEIYIRSEQTQSFPEGGKIKMETPETIRTSLQTGEWVTSIDFKDAYFHIPIQEQSRKYLRFHVQGQTYQFKALPFGLSTAPLEFTVIAKEVKLMATNRAIRIHQYLDDWLVRATSHQVCLQHTQDLVRLCTELGWLVNLEKSELEPKQTFDFVGYQFDLKSGRVQPTPDQWQNLQDKILKILSLPACPVQQFMSLIGLLTATEKQVYLGRLHMRPIQWHLKNSWWIPESLEKVIPIPTSLHPHLQWWLKEHNVLTGQPLHPIKHALQIFTDASKEGRGAHLNERTARGSWSLPESKLHINYLELKAVFLALKEFQDLCTYQIVLVVTDNTTVVSYITKEGGMRSGPLCALLWRILTRCTRKQVTLKARHIPGRLNVIADKLSRLGQTIQTEWSLLPEVFEAICSRWHWPQIDLFATSFNNKLPQYVSLMPDPLAIAVDALSLPWEDLDAYAFPPGIQSKEEMNHQPQQPTLSRSSSTTSTYAPQTYQQQQPTVTVRDLILTLPKTQMPARKAIQPAQQTKVVPRGQDSYISPLALVRVSTHRQ